MTDMYNRDYNIIKKGNFYKVYYRGKINTYPEIFIINYTIIEILNKIDYLIENERKESKKYLQNKI